MPPKTELCISTSRSLFCSLHSITHPQTLFYSTPTWSPWQYHYFSSSCWHLVSVGISHWRDFLTSLLFSYLFTITVEFTLHLPVCVFWHLSPNPLFSFWLFCLSIQTGFHFNNVLISPWLLCWFSLTKFSIPATHQNCFIKSQRGTSSNSWNFMVSDFPSGSQSYSTVLTIILIQPFTLTAPKLFSFSSSFHSYP